MKVPKSTDEAKQRYALKDLDIPGNTNSVAAITNLLRDYGVSFDELPKESPVKIIVPKQAMPKQSAYTSTFSNNTATIQRRLVLTWQQGKGVDVNWFKLYPGATATFNHQQLFSDEPLHSVLFDIGYTAPKEEDSLYRKAKHLAQQSWQQLLNSVLGERIQKSQQVIEPGSYQLNGLSYVIHHHQALSKEEVNALQRALKFKQLENYQDLLTFANSKLEAYRIVNFNALIGDGLSTLLGLKGEQLSISPHSADAVKLSVAFNESYADKIKHQIHVRFPQLMPYVDFTRDSMSVDIHALKTIVMPKICDNFINEAKRWSYLVPCYQQAQLVNHLEKALSKSPLQQALLNKYQVKLDKSPTLLALMLMQSTTEAPLEKLPNLKQVTSV